MSDEENEKEAWDSEIGGRMRIFVLNYCTDSLCFLNGTRSYRAAYTKIEGEKPVYIPDDETAAVGASKLLRKAKVKNAVKKLLAETQTELDSENSYRLLRDLVLQATYNPADIVDERGQLKAKSLEELGELAKCVEQIYQTKFGTRIQLASRSFAQDKLLKYYNLVREQDDIAAELPVIEVSSKIEDADEWNEAYSENENDSLETTAETSDGS